MQEAELYLVGGALLLYLFDSCLALYGDELLFATGLHGWHNVAAGNVLVLGRRLMLPNPLMPGARLLRVCWSRALAGDLSARQPEPPFMERATTPAFLQVLGPLQVGVTALLLLIAVALPAVLYASGQGLPLLLLLAAIYALNLAMTVWLWRVRTALGLGARACIFLTVDLLLCPPFAINLVRKITLQLKQAGDPLLFAREHFGAAQLAALCAQLARRVRAELAADETDGAHHQQLQALCRRLEEMVS